MAKNITKLIINNPYTEPTQHWRYVRESRDFSLKESWRLAGYVTATPNAEGFDNPGVESLQVLEVGNYG